jgi:hypothetical protein
MLSPAPTDKTAEMRQGVGPHGSAIRPWSSGKINTRGGSRRSVFTNLIAIVSAAIVSGIASIGASAQSTRVEHPINSVREIRASLRGCWISPEMSVPPQVTVRLSLRRNGEILGQPLISYENPHISEADRAALHGAVAAALARCTPLLISDALGGIIAGHPIHVKLGEGWRREKGAPTVPPER